MNGSITGSTGGLWSGWNGTFSPDANTLNATYTPTALEADTYGFSLILTSTGTNDCASVSDQASIQWDHPAPSTVIAWAHDSSLCSSDPVASLGTTMTMDGSQGVKYWMGGNGTFHPGMNNEAPTYTPTEDEMEGGNISLTFVQQSYWNACPASTDDVTINYNISPTVDAGADQTICKTEPNVILSGKITGASGGTWSGGSGTFSPDGNHLNATYTPTALEADTYGFSLTLTSTENNDCPTNTDQVFILRDHPAPSSVSASAHDSSLCSSNPTASLGATVTMDGSHGDYYWTGGIGTFNPGRNYIDPTYTPTEEEIAAGNITLSFVQQSYEGACPASADDVTINYYISPIVDAGPDQTVCKTEFVILSGQVTGASGGTWSGGSGSFFPSPSDLGATYTPSNADIVSGAIALTLISNGSETCITEDQTNLTFTICTGTTFTAIPGEKISLYPNPAQGSIHISADLPGNEELKYL